MNDKIKDGKDYQASDQSSDDWDDEEPTAVQMVSKFSVKDETGGPPKKMTCDRCGQTFVVKPRRWHEDHERQSYWIDPHNAPCGLPCLPYGNEYEGHKDGIHYGPDMCDRCK